MVFGVSLKGHVKLQSQIKHVKLGSETEGNVKFHSETEGCCEISPGTKGYLNFHSETKSTWSVILTPRDT
jgi:hypothetical protein